MVFPRGSQPKVFLYGEQGYNKVHDANHHTTKREGVIRCQRCP
jgi:hypothetical protein